MEGETNPFVAILVTIILIAINGMLASSEIAMVGLNENKLKQRAENGDRKAKLLLKMKRQPSSFLSTIQIGITLAGLLSGAFAADSLAAPITAWAAGMGVSGAMLKVVGTLSIVLITLIMTYFMLVFGELVPKRIAMARPDKTTENVFGLINGLSKITKPLVRLLSASTNGVLRLIGIDPNESGEPVTEDEIMLMIHEGHEQGHIEESEVEFVANLFEFTDRTVEDAMVPRTEIESVSSDATMDDVVKLMIETSHNRFPVYDGDLDTITGIIYGQDILKKLSDADHENIPVTDLMRAPFFVPETRLLVELFNDMKQHQVRMAVVVDGYGGTSGIITMMDVIEELVGDVELGYLDAIDEDENGHYRMDGRMEIEDVAEFLGIELGEDEYDTLSGFITHRLGYIPPAGQTPVMTYAGYQFKVLEMQGALVRSASVWKHEPNADTN